MGSIQYNESNLSGDCVVTTHFPTPSFLLEMRPLYFDGANKFWYRLLQFIFTFHSIGNRQMIRLPDFVNNRNEELTSL